MTNADALLDSDVLVALYLEADNNHQTALQMLERAQANNLRLAVTNLVIGETATVLSYRIGQSPARQFLGEARLFTRIMVNEEMHDETITLFQEQTTKRTSYVDCSNVVVMRRYNFLYLAAFDGFYKPFSFKMLA